MTDQKALAQIGVVGLAVMGSNIARNFARHDYTVAVYNRSTEKTDAFMVSTARTVTSSRPQQSKSLLRPWTPPTCADHGTSWRSH